MSGLSGFSGSELKIEDEFDKERRPKSSQRYAPSLRPAAAHAHQPKEMHVLRYSETLCPGGTVESSLAGTARVVMTWVCVLEGRLISVRQRLNRCLVHQVCSSYSSAVANF